MRSINKLFALILSAAAAVCMWAVPAQAYAYETAPAEAGFTVRQVFSFKNGNKPTAGDTFSYRLTACDANNPMPEGAKDGVLDFSLSGNSSRDFTVSIDREGVYKYKIEHTVSKKVSGYGYDMSVYTVEIYAARSESGEMKTAVVVIDGCGRKPAEIVYRHSYCVGGGIPKTGDSGAVCAGAVCGGSLLMSLGAYIICRRKMRPAAELRLK